MKTDSSLGIVISGFLDLMDKIQNETMDSFSLLQSFFYWVNPIFDVSFMGLIKKSTSEDMFTIISSFWKTEDNKIESFNRDTILFFRNPNYKEKLKIANIYQLFSKTIVYSLPPNPKNMTLQDICHGNDLIYSVQLEEDKYAWVALNSNHNELSEIEEKQQLKNIEITLRLVKVLYDELTDVKNRKSQISERQIRQFRHDLKPYPTQILDTISFIEETLAEFEYKKALDAIKEDLEVIKTNAYDLKKTITRYDLITLNQGWQTQHTNIYAFIKEIAERFRNQATIEIDGDNNLSLYIAPPKVKFIMQTLFNNTFKYGFRKQYLQEKKIYIKFYTKTQDEKIFLYIEYSNNGTPISKEKSTAIFEPQNGIGKGDDWHIALPNSLEIARKHGGNLILDTSYADGVKFIISLEANENLL